MSTKRMYFAMLALVFLLTVGVVGSVVAGNLFLEKQASKLNELKVEDKLLEEQQAALIQANKDIEKYTELEKISKSVVPQDKDQAKAVVEIFEIAKASKIKIKSVTFPTSNLGVKVPTSSGGGSGAGGDKSGAAAAPTISQAKPVDGIQGVYSLEMSIVPEFDETRPITYYQFLDFLGKLENNRRTAQVTQIKIAPLSNDKQNPTITFTLTLNIFVKPS